MKLKTDKVSPPATNAPTRQVPWIPLVGVIFIITMFYLAQVIGGSVVTGYYAAKGLSETEIVAALGSSVFAQFSFVLITQIVILYALYRFLKYYKTTFQRIGLVRPRWRDLWYGLSAVVPYYVLFFITAAVVTSLVPGFDVNQKQEIGFDNVQGFLPLGLTFLILVILQPIIEEIVVRGFIYDSLKKGLPIVLAVIGTSLLFAAAHLPAGGATGPLYIAAVDTFLLSLFLIYLREKTGSLWASITLHSFKNGVAFLALFIFKVA